LANGGVTKELGAFTVGDVVIEEGDALVGGVDGDVEPGIDAFGVVLDVGLLAGPHDVAIELLQLSADEVWVDVPVRSGATNVGGSDPAAVACFLVREGDHPVSIDADDSFSDLDEEPCKALVPCVFLAPAMAASSC